MTTKKELQAQIDELRAEIEQLKARIVMLEARPIYYLAPEPRRWTIPRGPWCTYEIGIDDNTAQALLDQVRQSGRYRHA